MHPGFEAVHPGSGAVHPGSGAVHPGFGEIAIAIVGGERDFIYPIPFMKSQLYLKSSQIYLKIASPVCTYYIIQ